MRVRFIAFDNAPMLLCETVECFSVTVRLVIILHRRSQSIASNFINFFKVISPRKASVKCAVDFGK